MYNQKMKLFGKYRYKQEMQVKNVCAMSQDYKSSEQKFRPNLFANM